MTHGIRFVLDGIVREIREVDPTMTVLDYVRTVERRTGTKEGCAEGDCGACTVVVCALEDGRLRYRAVNACLLFLPTLDGKQLLTIEDLCGADGRLHPAQQAMVDTHASQCGFCTPGVVMSLFALARSDRRPGGTRINDALAGNLCRCTGYRPIVEAAHRMYEVGEDRSIAAQEAETVELLRSIARTETLEVRAADRVFFAPTTVSAVETLLRRHPGARLLGGGTDVGLLVTKQHQDLDAIIYLGDVAELRTVRIEGDSLLVGGAASLADTAREVGRLYPDFGELLRRFGSEQVRNAGTLAGNIANASPIGDTLPPLLALNARVELRKDAATRTVALDDFVTAYRRTLLAPGEFIERIVIPVHADRQFAAYKVSKRFDQDISAVCAAFSLQLDGGTVRDIRVAFGGMAATPRRATACEQALVGRPWVAETIDAAVGALNDEFSPISDLRAGARYRTLVAGNLLRKFWIETTDRSCPTRVPGVEAVHA